VLDHRRRPCAKTIRIPIAVKLSPFYTSAVQPGRTPRGREGVNGVVLFNRIFQPEIDIEELDVHPKLGLSSLRGPAPAPALRSVSCATRLSSALACTGGVHTAADVAKALLAGADGVQVTGGAAHPTGPTPSGRIPRRA
jgi:dihydroorotate dehydrogenase (fumarate)